MKCNFKLTYTKAVVIDGEEFVEVHYTCPNCGNQRFKRVSPLTNINCEVAE